MVEDKKSNGHTGYDAVIHRNWEVFRDTLEGLDYRGFVRGCPRHPGHVTIMDLEWALKMKKAAEGFSESEGSDPVKIIVPSNPYDRFAFSEFVGEIVKEIEREIKRSDPRNMEAEATKDALKSLNLSALEVIREIAPSKVEEAVQRDMTIQKSLNKEEIENAINDLNQKEEEKDEKIAEIERIVQELRNSPPPTPSPRVSIPAGSGAQEIPERLSLKMKVERFWTLKLRDIDDAPRVTETRGKENGGNILVELSIGDGNFTWAVNCAPESHPILYERTKKILIDFLETGKVKSDLTYSLSRRGEKRSFSPEVEDDHVHMESQWEPVRGLFSRELTRDITVQVGESSWTVNVRMKLNELEKFKELLVELVTRIVMSGEMKGENDGPYA